MGDSTDTLAPALRRALQLFADPPATPEIGNGCLDLLTGRTEHPVPVNAGAVQALWASRIGSLV